MDEDTWWETVTEIDGQPIDVDEINFEYEKELDELFGYDGWELNSD